MCTATSAISFSLPPLKPTSATTLPPCARANSAALTTLGEFLLDEDVLVAEIVGERRNPRHVVTQADHAQAGLARRGGVLAEVGSHVGSRGGAATVATDEHGSILLEGRDDR